MSKTRIFALLMLALIFASILTNPPREQFEKALTIKAKDILEKQLHYKDKDAVLLGMTLFGDKVVQDFIDRSIIVKNYYLFSVVKLKWQDTETPIGGGAFKTIWISPKIDEKADEIIAILKDL
ncbi:hypothetical protein [Sphingobacterium yanglingense]|uniref:DUF4359 domain-containing protein n=1 Tax=Sphingobacterium yanglingense TaxID=1437280 RepID=A0A4V6PXA1_9SPHI|nr:hypothetical protein [Sphingobacterium yanglingense]TDQ72166.1 hypothetical protein CLV99_4629 [Sphingobacterium yanglingense]